MLKIRNDTAVTLKLLYNNTFNIASIFVELVIQFMAQLTSKSSVLHDKVRHCCKEEVNQRTQKRRNSCEKWKHGQNLTGVVNFSKKKQSYSEARTVTENRCHTSRTYAAEDLNGRFTGEGCRKDGRGGEDYNYRLDNSRFISA